MGNVVSISLLLIITIIVFNILSSYGHSQPIPINKPDKFTHKGCADVACEDPPSSVKCTRIIADLNKSASFPQPRGGGAECCPLWKCGAQSGVSFFTFNGVAKDKFGSKGGQEIVDYNSPASRSKQGKLTYNDVRSRATGNHDAKALAGDTTMTTKDMKQIEDTLKLFGLQY